MHKLQQQQLLLNHCLQLALEKCKQNQQSSPIVRLPLEVYRQCQTIFKMELQVASLLYQIYRRDFFIKNINDLQKDRERAPQNLYLQIVAESNTILQLQSQIILRFVLLGLCLRMGKPPCSSYRYRIKQLFRSLQIEIELSATSESLSDLILNELKHMQTDFDYVEFYESLLSLFDSMANLKITNWLNNQLAQKRRKYEENNQQTQPFRLQIDNIQQTHYKPKTINKRITLPANSNHKQLTSSQKTPQNLSLEQDCKVKVKADTSKNRNSIEQPREVPLSLILASRRKSLGRVLTQTAVTHSYSPAKYMFKSVKKTQENSSIKREEASARTDENGQTPLKEQAQNTHRQKPKLVHWLAKQQQSSNSNSRMLCPATPPRPQTRGPQ